MIFASLPIHETAHLRLEQSWFVAGKVSLFWCVLAPSGQSISFFLILADPVKNIHNSPLPKELSHRLHF